MNITCKLSFKKFCQFEEKSYLCTRNREEVSTGIARTGQKTRMARSSIG